MGVKMEFLLDSLFTFATSFEKKTVGADQKKARLQGVHRVMGIMGIMGIMGN